MSEMFYRVHWDGCPEFSAENAESALWGADREDALYGYSCCYSAEDLIAYFARHGEPLGDDTVVVFEGQRVGTGFDGEPLAVPTGAVRHTTWAEFVAGS